MKIVPTTHPETFSPRDIHCRILLTKRVDVTIIARMRATRSQLMDLPDTYMRHKAVPGVEHSILQRADT